MFRVQDLGLGFRIYVKGSGFRFRVQDLCLGFRI
jgi:hypothetical protein